jgi:tRNA(His) 5'-end guanylyltransferase
MKVERRDPTKRHFSTPERNMAKSKYEYVKNFELPDPCLPNCWIVVRIDGRGFSRFADIHGYVKPNDVRGLNLMTRAAMCVMDEFETFVSHLDRVMNIVLSSEKIQIFSVVGHLS